jgi:hypothetical protein
VEYATTTEINRLNMSDDVEMNDFSVSEKGWFHSNVISLSL